MYSRDIILTVVKCCIYLYLAGYSPKPLRIDNSFSTLNFPPLATPIPSLEPHPPAVCTPTFCGTRGVVFDEGLCLWVDLIESTVAGILVSLSLSSSITLTTGAGGYKD